MLEQPGKTLHVWQTLADGVALVARRPHIYLLVAAPRLLASVSIFVVGPGFLIGVFVPIFVDAALISAVYAQTNGETPNIIAAYKRVRERIGPLIEYELRYFGAILLLCITVIGIPWAIRTVVRWSLGTQAVLLNDASAKDAISQSCRLVQGLWWQVAGALLLSSIIGGLFVGGISAFVWPRGVEGRVATAIWGLALAPVHAAFFTLIYLRLYQQDRSMPAAP